MPAPFESFINHVMSKHDTADKLRQLTHVQSPPMATSSLSESVNTMLVEQEIANQFDYNGYDSEERKHSVLDKLYKVRNKISTKYFPNDK